MLSLSLSIHEPMLSLSLSMHEPMLSLSMLVPTQIILTCMLIVGIRHCTEHCSEDCSEHDFVWNVRILERSNMFGTFGTTLQATW